MIMASGRHNSELLPESRRARRYAPVPAADGNGRKFARFYFRTLATARIHPVPVIGLDTQECFVLTRDLSQGGISFLHPTKLAIGQRIDLAFDDGKELTVRAQWMRQLASRCYLIGCKFAVLPDHESKAKLAALNRK